MGGGEEGGGMEKVGVVMGEGWRVGDGVEEMREVGEGYLGGEWMGEMKGGEKVEMGIGDMR